MQKTATFEWAILTSEFAELGISDPSRACCSELGVAADVVKFIMVLARQHDVTQGGACVRILDWVGYVMRDMAAPMNAGVWEVEVTADHEFIDKMLIAVGALDPRSN